MEPGSKRVFLGLMILNMIFFAFISPSTAQTSWVKASHPLGITSFGGVAYGNSTFVVVSTSVLTSPDGVTWTQRNLPSSDQLSEVTFGESTGSEKVVATSFNGKIWTSPDGITWTDQSVGISGILYNVAFGGSKFAAVGDAPDTPEISSDASPILTSSNGSSWTSQTPPTPRALMGVTYGTPGGTGLFVAVGDEGTIITSPDGVTWSNQLSNIGDPITDVAFGNGIFVAVGGDNSKKSRILTSSDGVTWTQRSAGVNEIINGITFGGLGGAEKFVAVTGNGKILTSPDGINWTQEVSNNTTLLTDITYGNSKFIAVGEGGTILVSSADAPSIPAVSPSGLALTVLSLGFLLWLFSRRHTSTGGSLGSPRSF